MTAPVSEPLAGTALYADVQRYESFGVHRFGSPGADAALDWISRELRAAGLMVAPQHFTMARQYLLAEASLQVGGQRLPVMPQWWLPEAQPDITLTAPIVPAGDAAGGFVRLSLPYDRGAYLNAAHREAVAAVLARRPAAVLVSIEHPSGEIFAYNVSQADAPWPVPVILVAPRHQALLAAAEASAAPVTLSVRGQHGRDVAGRNVVGRLDRGAARTVVVSTPVTSWFESTGERGPGIAAFLAIARTVVAALPDVNLVFVATSGHEIGHGGMEVFLRDAAPKPAEVAVWLHLGASIACHRRERDGEGWAIVPEVDARFRFIGVSASLAEVIEPAMRGVAAGRVVGEKAAAGELRDIHAAGYPHFFGMAGLHPLFHTPQDLAAITGPAVLEPTVRALADALVCAARH